VVMRIALGRLSASDALAEGPLQHARTSNQVASDPLTIFWKWGGLILAESECVEGTHSLTYRPPDDEAEEHQGDPSARPMQRPSYARTARCS